MRVFRAQTLNFLTASFEDENLPERVSLEGWVGHTPPIGSHVEGTWGSKPDSHLFPPVRI